MGRYDFVRRSYEIPLAESAASLVEMKFFPEAELRKLSAELRRVPIFKQAFDAPAINDGPTAEVRDSSGMAAPAPEQEDAPANYLVAEQIGQQMQDAQEMAYHRQRAVDAEQAAQMAQQEAAAAQQQAMAVQQEAEAAKQQISQAMNQAQLAEAKATQQTMLAANLRTSQQQLRQAILELASQDPAPDAAAQLAQSTAPPPPPPVVAPPPPPGSPEEQAMMAQQQQAMMGGMPPGPPPGPGGPPPPGMDPSMMGGPPPPGPPPGPGMPPGPPPPGMDPKMGSMKAAVLGRALAKRKKEKTASMKTQAIGAGMGALGMGLYRGVQARQEADTNPNEIRQEIVALKSEQDGSFHKAMKLVAKEQQLNKVQALQGSGLEGHYALGNAARGAVEGALLGSAAGAVAPSINKNIGRLSAAAPEVMKKLKMFL